MGSTTIGLFRILKFLRLALVIAFGVFTSLVVCQVGEDADDRPKLVVLDTFPLSTSRR